jgi:hypothetical protein
MKYYVGLFKITKGQDDKLVSIGQRFRTYRQAEKHADVLNERLGNKVERDFIVPRGTLVAMVDWDQSDSSYHISTNAKAPLLNA